MYLLSSDTTPSNDVREVLEISFCEARGMFVIRRPAQGGYLDDINYETRCCELVFASGFLQ